jgi:hypothetical protein
LQNIYTSVLARRSPIVDVHRTLPHEAGWATEALVFVQTEGAHPELTVHAEVSPDGLNWVARPDVATLREGDNIADLSLTHFGNWLRVVVTGASEAAPATVLIHLVTKG